MLAHLKPLFAADVRAPLTPREYTGRVFYVHGQYTGRVFLGVSNVQSARAERHQAGRVDILQTLC